MLLTHLASLALASTLSLAAAPPSVGGPPWLSIELPANPLDPSTKGEKSRALHVVYEDGAKFKEAAGRFENEAAKLYQVSRGGDEAAVKAQIGAVGKTCAGCHDNFRQKQ